MIASLLTGFTGQEKQVRLEGMMNGRKNASFLGQSNISAILPKGTIGEILEHKYLPSGNVALFIEIQNNAHKGQKVWVYYNRTNPTLTLLKDTDSKPKVAQQEPLRIQEAKATITTKPTTALSKLVQAAIPEAKAQAVNSISQAQINVDRINQKEVLCSGTCGTKIIDTSTVKALISPRQVRPQARLCNQIMSAKGQVGEIGSDVISIMAEDKYRQTFTRNNAMGSLCPKFSHLNEEQKLFVWSWFWTALASEESSCKSDVAHPVTYKNKQGEVKILNPYPGYGLWALEKDRNIREWRGSACANIGTPAGQARCAIDIMSKQIKSKGTADVRSGSYWGPVHRASQQLVPHMKRLSLCF
ncbi:MAG: hypothetical protein ACLGGX_07585 [Bdellovibrionia bacterium]